MIDDAMSFVDVMEGAIPKTAYGRVIFFPGDVIVSFVQQFHGTVKAAGAVHSGINRRVVVQILAIVNRGMLNFFNGFVNLFDGVLFFLVHVMSWSQVLQMSPGVAQVGERMEIRRMPSRFVSKAEGSAQGNKKHE
jgi:hypothetical protein